jgi:hypothetical protein
MYEIRVLHDLCRFAFVNRYLGRMQRCDRTVFEGLRNGIVDGGQVARLQYSVEEPEGFCIQKCLLSGCLVNHTHNEKENPRKAVMDYRNP